MHGFYLVALCVSLLGLVVLDRRFKLAYWRDGRRTLLTLGYGVGIFLVWDLLGVLLGIFFHGKTDLLTGIFVAPEIPLEELFFLTLLCYLTLLLFNWIRSWRTTI